MPRSSPLIGPSRRVVMITGASAGLGAELSREITRRRKAGAMVLVARRQDRLDDLALEVKGLDPDLEVLTIAADLALPEVPERLVREALARFGGVDILINNAGLGLPTLFADANPLHLRQQLEVNFIAPLLLTRLAIASLIERKGIVINIGSSITCVANSALGGYGATKAGLAYWNDAMRRELVDQGVKFCLVEPGPIRTEFSRAYNKLSTEGVEPNPVVESPHEWMMADVSDVARRVIDLIEKPRRRLSVLRRLVWPFRILGALFYVFPTLGDWFVSRAYGVKQPARAPR